MAQLETKLVATLIDRISGPANKAAHALKGVASATNQKVGGVFSGINRELGYTNRALDNMRGRMVDSVAQLYILKNALAAPIKAAATFEDRLVDIGQKAGKTREEMKRVGEEISRIAKSTTRSQQEVADAMDNLVGRGLNFDTAFKALPTIGKAATAYKAEIDDMASTSMALMDNFKVKAEQLPEVIDRLSQASKAGAFELKNMAKEFPQLLAIGQMRGMTGVIGATQIATALQVVQKGAGTPEQAATNLRNVLQKMDFEETRNKFGAAAMKRDALAHRTSLADAPDFVKRALATNFAGMKAKEVKEVEGVYKAQWLKGELLKRARLGESPIEAIRSVTRDVIGADKLDAMVARMQKAGKSADDIAKALIEAKINGISVSDLFADSEAQAGIASLVANVKLYNDILTDVDKNSKGAVDRDLKDRAQTTGDAFRRLTNAFDAFNTAVGDALAPALTPLTEALEGVTTWLKDLTKAHPILVRNVTLGTAAFMGLSAALISARWAFLGLRAAGLAFIATPLGATLTAIGAAVLLIWTNWDKVKEILPNVTKRFEETVSWMKEHWDELPGKVWKVAVAIKDKLLNTDWIQVGRDMISGLWDGMKEWLNKILTGVGDFVGKVKGLLTGGGAASLSGGDGAAAGSAIASASRAGGGGGASALDGVGIPQTPRAGRYSAADAAALIRRVGGRPEEARVLGAISQPKSRGNPYAHNPNARTGDNSYGLWQINMLGRMGPQRRRMFGLRSNADLFNPEVNARVALKMHRMARSFRDWSTYRHGAHRRYLGPASGGARAEGGPVHAGQSYVVGEQGWEIFKPRQSGEIVNQKQLAAEGRNAAHGGQTIHFAPTIHVNGAQDAQLVANQVERHIRNKLGSIFRGSHSDVGFAPV